MQAGRKEIVRRDYLLFSALMGIPLIWIATGLAMTTGTEVRGWLITAAGTTLLSPIIALYRYKTIRLIVERGVTVRGVLDDVRFQITRGRFEYRYAFDGRDFRGVQTFVRYPDPRRINPGTEVRVLLDPQAPWLSLLPMVYEKLP